MCKTLISPTYLDNGRSLHTHHQQDIREFELILSTLLFDFDLFFASVLFICTFKGPYTTPYTHESAHLPNGLNIPCTSVHTVV